MYTPVCYILMPFGKKYDASGILVDFESVYSELIAPAVREAGFDPLRADEEMTGAGGLLFKPKFERIVLSELVVADLTTASPNVFYEMGVRHASQPRGTILV